MQEEEEEGNNSKQMQEMPRMLRVRLETNKNTKQTTSKYLTNY